jgi:hypothetical protein
MWREENTPGTFLCVLEPSRAKESRVAQCTVLFFVNLSFNMAVKEGNLPEPYLFRRAGSVGILFET